MTFPSLSRMFKMGLEVRVRQCSEQREEIVDR